MSPPVYAGAPNPPDQLNSSLATASLILGIFGVLCLGPLLGIPAIILGIRARKKISKAPTVYGGSRAAGGGIIAGVASFFSFGMYFLLFVMFQIQGRELQEQRSCVANMEQMVLAIELWSTNHDNKYPDSLVALTNDLSVPVAFHCPSDKIKPVPPSLDTFSESNISYRFLAPGQTHPTNSRQIILECPIHGNKATANCSVWWGQKKPGR